MMKRLFLIAMAACLGASILAQETELPIIRPPRVDVNPASGSLDGSVSKLVDDFFASLQKNQIDQAYEQLTKGTKIADRPDDIITLKSKTQQAIEMFGDI